MDLCISTMDSFSWAEAEVKSSSRMPKVSIIFSGSTWKGLILAKVFFMDQSSLVVRVMRGSTSL